MEGCGYSMRTSPYFCMTFISSSGCPFWSSSDKKEFKTRKDQCEQLRSIFYIGVTIFIASLKFSWLKPSYITSHLIWCYFKSDITHLSYYKQCLKTQLIIAIIFCILLITPMWPRQYCDGNVLYNANVNPSCKKQFHILYPCLPIIIVA